MHCWQYVGYVYEGKTTEPVLNVFRLFYTNRRKNSCCSVVACSMNMPTASAATAHASCTERLHTACMSQNTCQVTTSGIHAWDDDAEFTVYKRCQHPANDSSRVEKPALMPGSKAFDSLKKILMDKKLAKVMPHLVKNLHTSRVESWNWVKWVMC